jgi:hypothetical protein
VIQLANMIAGALVIVTLIYVYLTYRILQTNRATVEQMRIQQENMIRPYITVSATVMSGTGMFLLKIKNSGISAAQNLRLSIDRSFFQFGMRDDHKNLKCFFVFNKSIDTFGPGAEMIFHLGLGKDIFSPQADPNCMPTLFSIGAQYSFSGREFSETTVIDLMPYREAAVSFDPLIAEMEKLRKTLERERDSS